MIKTVLIAIISIAGTVEEQFPKVALGKVKGDEKYLPQSWICFTEKFIDWGQCTLLCFSVSLLKRMQNIWLCNNKFHYDV